MDPNYAFVPELPKSTGTSAGDEILQQEAALTNKSILNNTIGRLRKNLHALTGAATDFETAKVRQGRFCGFGSNASVAYFLTPFTEIERAIERLLASEVGALAAWLEEYEAGLRTSDPESAHGGTVPR